jgi:hypothetical protein
MGSSSVCRVGDPSLSWSVGGDALPLSTKLLENGIRGREVGTHGGAHEVARADGVLHLRGLQAAAVADARGAAVAHLPPRVSSDSSDSNAAVSALVPTLAAHSEPTAYPKPNLTGDGGGPA